MEHHNQYDVAKYFKECLEKINHSLAGELKFNSKKWEYYKCPHSKNTKTSARYRAFSDGVPNLNFRCMRCDISQNFSYKGNGYTKIPPIDHQKIAFERAKKQKDDDIKHKSVLKTLRERWDNAKPCTSHGYLERKSLTTGKFEALRVDSEGWLLCPLWSVGGEMISIQSIGRDGQKLFTKGAPTKGGYLVLSPIEAHSTIYFAEGVATALSILEAVQKPVICVYGKHFSDIAPIIAKAYPKKNFVFCCDRAGEGEHHTSEDNARMAIANTGDAYALPDFSSIPPDLWPHIPRSDYNDLLVLLLASGLERDAALNQIKDQLSTKNLKKDIPMSEKPKSLSGTFKVTEAGLIYEKYNEAGEIEESTKVTMRYFNILGVHNDYYSEEDFGVVLEFDDEFEKRKQWSMPRTLMSDPKSLDAALSYRGCIALDIRKLIIFIRSSVPEKTFIGINKTGWHIINKNRFFALPHQIIGNGEDNAKIKFNSLDKKNMYESKGSLKDWQDNIGKYLPNQSRILFGVSFALSSLLLDLVGAENGGIHFYGESSSGKTTLLQICASLFGDTENYRLSWKTTPNALERLAVSRNDCSLILDESSQYDNEKNKQLASAIYLMMNGSGKSRLNANTSLKETLSWRCNILSSGENPIRQLLIDAGERDNEGVAVRLIDLKSMTGSHGIFDFIPKEFKSGHEFSNYFKDATKKFYGSVVPEFIKLLIEIPREKIIEEIKNIEELLDTSVEDSQNQVKRCIKRFAMAAYAGELAFKILSIKKGDAQEAVSACLYAWLRVRGGTEDGEATKLIQQVKDYVDTHGARCKNLNGISQERDVMDGYKEMLGGRLVHYYTSDGFKRMTKGFDQEFAIETLLKAGYITEAINSNSKGIKKYLRQKKIEGSNSRYYHFDGANWNVEDLEI